LGIPDDADQCSGADLAAAYKQHQK
jgi:hypothetical protein